MFDYSSLLIIKILQFNCLLKRKTLNILFGKETVRSKRTKDGRTGEKGVSMILSKESIFRKAIIMCTRGNIKNTMLMASVCNFG